MAHSALTRAATAAMHSHPEQCTHPPPPVPPFLLAQILSLKQIVPTDNTRPKTDDAKRRHRLLEGQDNHMTYSIYGLVISFHLKEKLDHVLLSAYYCKPNRRDSILQKRLCQDNLYSMKDSFPDLPTDNLFSQIHCHFSHNCDSLAIFIMYSCLWINHLFKCVS